MGVGKDEQVRGELGDSVVFKYALSCLAATVAETATYPLDLTKTRLQIQGERLHAGHTKKLGMIQTAVGIVRNEGALKLWQGVSPAVVRHYIYTGVRVGVYEQLRDKIFQKQTDGTFPFWKAIVSGMLGGAIAQFLASPTDLVKVQMQMEGKRRLEGLPPRVTSMWQAARKVLAEAGVRGLWKGWVPNCQRAALVNMADLATYDKAKHTMLRHTNLKDNYVTHALASVFAGLAAAIASTPADVVKTRVMNQPTDPTTGRGTLYSSSLDCLRKTVRAEGFGALYKGFVPIWTRMAPWSLTFWVSYERIRWLTGASSF